MFKKCKNKFSSPLTAAAIFHKQAASRLLLGIFHSKQTSDGAVCWFSVSSSLDAKIPDYFKQEMEETEKRCDAAISVVI